MSFSSIPRHIELVLQDLSHRVRTRFGDRVLEIRLYGSQARGDARADSDVDVFVRVAGLVESERRQLFEIAGELSIDHLVTMQILAPSPKEYAWLERYECRILRDIQAEGVAV